MPSPASTAHAASGTNKDHMERRAQYDQHRRVHGTLLMQLRKVCDCRSEAWHVASHKRLSLRRHLWPCKASKTVRTRVNEQSCLRRESRRCIWRKHGIGVCGAVAVDRLCWLPMGRTYAACTAAPHPSC